MKIEVNTDQHLGDKEIMTIGTFLNDCNSLHIEIKKGKAVICFDEEPKMKVSKRDPKHDAMMSNAKEVISFLNSTTGKKFSPTGKASLKLVFERIKDGHNLEDFKIVIKKKSDQWKGDPKMDAYLTPQTLFRASNFERYLNERDGEELADQPFGELDAIMQGKQ